MRRILYKVSCPSCGVRAARRHIFGSPTLYHRCRGCGAMFGLTAAGWVNLFIVVAMELFWFALAETRIVSPKVAIGFILATCALGIWLLPYFSPVRLRQTRRS